MDQVDAVDIYGTFTEAEARRVGVATLKDESTTRISATQKSEGVIVGKREV